MKVQDKKAKKMKRQDPDLNSVRVARVYLQSCIQKGCLIDPNKT